LEQLTILLILPATSRINLNIQQGTSNNEEKKKEKFYNY